MSGNPATVTAATRMKIPTQTVTAGEVGLSDVVYLGDGQAPVRIRHVDRDDHHDAIYAHLYPSDYSDDLARFEAFRARG